MVDVGRFGYTATMRLHRDAPELVTAVRWYKVPWDTPALGVPTFASSSTWDPCPQLPDLGEVAGSRRWTNGTPPPGQPPDPPAPVGTEEQWLHGVLTTDPGPPAGP